MARNEIYRLPDTGQLVLDVQGLEHVEVRSRLVIPLVPRGQDTPIVKRLNLVIEFEGGLFMLATQAMGSIPVRELGPAIARLDDKWDFAITDAIDVLLGG